MKTGPRAVFFVCAAISDSGELITKVIEASSVKDANTLFFTLTSIKVKNIHGPFLKKRTKVIENTRILKFSEQNKKAIYNDWEVDAFFLKEPENHAYLVFIKRIDNIKQSPPIGNVVVPLSDLKGLNE